ncbi:speract/scavenger receptor domain-containing protein [Anaeramoeba ignava]|uniref:Speract/scavenger receptor domain-containing protein n=1 Tax=Anaeramoeba ignava TaxID=1746090 RepID=A0A9Q0LYL1_ANAIG|nr:speract/scavenger receptor domain-containing protein [Anaeramoeba ignava]
MKSFLFLFYFLLFSLFLFQELKALETTKNLTQSQREKIRNLCSMYPNHPDCEFFKQIQEEMKQSQDQIENQIENQNQNQNQNQKIPEVVFDDSISNQNPNSIKYPNSNQNSNSNTRSTGITFIDDEDEQFILFESKKNQYFWISIITILAISLSLACIQAFIFQKKKRTVQKKEIPKNQIKNQNQIEKEIENEKKEKLQMVQKNVQIDGKVQNNVQIDGKIQKIDENDGKVQKTDENDGKVQKTYPKQNIWRIIRWANIFKLILTIFFVVSYYYEYKNFQGQKENLLKRYHKLCINNPEEEKEKGIWTKIWDTITGEEKKIQKICEDLENELNHRKLPTLIKPFMNIFEDIGIIWIKLFENFGEGFGKMLTSFFKNLSWSAYGLMFTGVLGSGSFLLINNSSQLIKAVSTKRHLASIVDPLLFFKF